MSFTFAVAISTDSRACASLSRMTSRYSSLPCSTDASIARMAQQCHARPDRQLYCVQPETVRMPYFRAEALPVLRESRRSEGQGASASPRSSLRKAYTVAPAAVNRRPEQSMVANRRMALGGSKVQESWLPSYAEKRLGRRGM